MQEDRRSEWSVSKMFLFGMLFVCLVVTLFYGGEYKRSKKDGEVRGSEVVQQFNVLNQYYDIVLKDDDF